MAPRPAVGWIAAVLVIGSLAIACSSEPELRHFEIIGEVAGIAPERQEIVINHQEIVGFMAAMTMPFKVRDQAMLEGIALGDPITAVLEVGSAGPVIIEIEKATTAP